MSYNFADIFSNLLECILNTEINNFTKILDKSFFKEFPTK